MNLIPHPALQDVLIRIAGAAEKAGRAAGDVKLIAVSKTFGAPNILPLLQAGQVRFGANRLQDAATNRHRPRDQYDKPEHTLQGPLQANTRRADGRGGYA